MRFKLTARLPVTVALQSERFPTGTYEISFEQLRRDASAELKARRVDEPGYWIVARFPDGPSARVVYEEYFPVTPETLVAELMQALAREGKAERAELGLPQAN